MFRRPARGDLRPTSGGGVKLLRLLLYGFVFAFLLARSGWILLRGRLLKLAGRDRSRDYAES